MNMWKIAKETTASSVRFQILKAASMKMAVFFVSAPCSMAEVYRNFRGATCLYQRGDNGDN
jgi:hypothetical protein